MRNANGWKALGPIFVSFPNQHGPLTFSRAAGLNYGSESFVEDLKKGTALGVDVFFDCVGGSILDQILPRISKFGRIAACGAISGYNQKESTRFENWFHVISMRLKIQGFIVLDYADHAQGAFEILKQAIANRKLALDEQSQTIDEVTFEDIPKVWLRLFEGGQAYYSAIELSYLSIGTGFRAGKVLIDFYHKL